MLVVQEQLRAIGLQMDLIPMPMGSLQEAWGKAEYDAIYFAALADYDRSFSQPGILALIRPVPFLEPWTAEARDVLGSADGFADGETRSRTRP
jgi:hypothetical protein